MNWLDVFELRRQAGAGLYLALTRRCPLRCAHCSTSSTLLSEQADEQVYLRFVNSFTSDDHPEILWLTGGEPLLRPRLVMDITERAHRVGTRVAITTGLFFARQGCLPASLVPVLQKINFVTASLDVFHEREVPRDAAFRTLDEMLAAGVSVGLQVTGIDDDDPYLSDVLAEIRHRFGRAIGVYVALLKPAGRAKEWLDADGASSPPTRPSAARPLPQGCDAATWPVVTFSGAVVGCCNQETIDNPPEHLLLGDTGSLTWPALRQAMLSRPILRVLRTVGPRAAAYDAGQDYQTSDYCSTCRALSPSAVEAASAITSRGSWTTVEQLSASLKQDATQSRLVRSRYAEALNTD